MSKIKRVVYDIETLNSCYTYTDLDIDTKEIKQFVIHPRRNELNAFLDYYETVDLGVGFNNQGFDYPVIHFMFNKRKEWNEELKLGIIGVENIIHAIHGEAQRIIDLQNNPTGFFQTVAIKEEDSKVFQLDLFKVWHYNNKAKSTGLKGLEVSMNLDNVMEMTVDHKQFFISDEEIEEVLEYNKNDVIATHEFYLKSKDKIRLRKSIYQKYKLQCYNWNNGKIGEELILHLYCQQTGRNYWDVKKLRSYYNQIELKNCIPSNVFFTEKIFQNILDKFSSKVITMANLEDDSLKKKEGEIGTILYKDCEITYGIGGIHGVTKKGVYESDDKHIIKSLDVASLYPNLAIILGLYIKHLGEVFIKVYKEGIVDVRMAEKAKPKDQRDMVIIDGFKEAANIPYGKSGDKNSFLFDYNYTFSTTVAGQLYLTMLIERLGIIPNMKLLMVNTDGMEVLIERKYEGLYSTICSQWEEDINLTLEFVDYNKMVIADVNNYLAFTTTGKVKNKGRFEVDKVVGDEPAYHKDNSFRVVPLALQQYFGYGIPVERTIKNHLNNEYGTIKNHGILDFCGRQKFTKDSYGETIDIQIGKKLTVLTPDNWKDFAKKDGWRTLWNEDNWVKEEWFGHPTIDVDRAGIDTKSLYETLDSKYNYETNVLNSQKQQKITRYYIHSKGSTFIKRYLKGTSAFIHKGFQVRVMNKLIKKDTLEDYGVNITFYIKECYKEIDKIESKQLNLF